MMSKYAEQLRTMVVSGKVDTAKLLECAIYMESLEIQLRMANDLIAVTENGLNAIIEDLERKAEEAEDENEIDAGRCIYAQIPCNRCGKCLKIGELEFDSIG